MREVMKTKSCTNLWLMKISQDINDPVLDCAVVFGVAHVVHRTIVHVRLHRSTRRARRENLGETCSDLLILLSPDQTFIQFNA
jgi:hypothetical protein